MSNISRRDFMKTAGVMTLAVAASGVLAGCSTAAEEVKPTTSGTITAGDYTVSVLGTKLYTFYKEEKASKVAADDPSYAQYLLVELQAIKNKDDASTMGAISVTTNGKVSEASDLTKVVKDVFGTKAAFESAHGLLTSCNGSITIPTATNKAYTIENGYLACVACKVATKTNLTGVSGVNYETPAITLYTLKDGKVDGQITINVPAATTIYNDKKTIEVTVS